MAIELTKYEQETIILYNEEEATASVYTHDPKLKKKLNRLLEKYPEQICLEAGSDRGAVSYLVPKKLVSIREPFSEDRRRKLSERQKAAGVVPPGRKKK